MLIKILIALLLLGVTMAITKEEVFNLVIFQATKQNGCTTNQILINNYMEALKKYNFEMPTPRFLKNDINKFLPKLSYEKVFTDFTSLIYKICQVQFKDTLRQPIQNNSNVNISVTGILHKHHYLKANLHPDKITQLIQYLPPVIQNILKMVRYRIVDHVLYTQCWPTDFIEGHLVDIIINQITQNIHELPDMDFIVFTRDQLHTRLIKDIFMDDNYTYLNFDGYYELSKRVVIDLPGFMRSVDIGGEMEFNKFIIPDSYIMHSRWQKILNETLKANAEIPWEQKIQKAFFRGQASGQSYQDEHRWWNISKYYPRMNAYNISLNNPDYLDFAFSVPIYGGQGSIKFIKQHGINFEQGEYVGIYGHLKFKYQISIDGFTAAWERPCWSMLSTSVLIKQQSQRVQWFYQEMVANVHYVPVQWDLSDLIDKIKYLKQHDEWARNITKNANEFAKRFNPPQIKRDLVNILKQYASHQRWKAGYVQRFLLKTYKYDTLEISDANVKRIQSYLKSAYTVLFIAIASFISVRYFSKKSHLFTSIQNQQN